MKTLIHTLASFLFATIASVQISTAIDAATDDGLQEAVPLAASSSAPRVRVSEGIPAASETRAQAAEPNSAFGGLPLHASPLAYALFGTAALTLTIVGRRVCERADRQA